MRDYTIKKLLSIYQKKKIHKLRVLIKTLLKDKKIDFKYRQFLIKASTNSAIESMILFDEYNEGIILNLIEFYSKKKYDFIDIGANIGLHSLAAASTKSNIEIYSFEPEPNNFYDFINNITINKFKQIRPFMIGLGNTIKNEKLYINESWNKGKHSLVNQLSANSEIIIPISTLDTFQDNIISPCLFIKIDVEGFEKEVIEGASNILKKTKNIVLSIELINGNNSTETCQNIINSLEGYGFEQLYMFKNNKLCQVSKYIESSDYLLIKGDISKSIFSEYEKTNTNTV